MLLTVVRLPALLTHGHHLSLQRSQEVDWSRYPTVPRPSQVPPVFTVFGRVPDPRSPVSGRLIPRTPLSTLYHPHTSIRKY
ncbi:hypothetical protein PR048_025181 [Dryococelus australis]|uniref:Secreted protein n=1 Tax=Dryococelus australis TaxID=614101 RepID=A0ABQ9GQP5_9NEOP|nr:hypothetical protein PR048_025181 [Dryococelus australis]